LVKTWVQRKPERAEATGWQAMKIGLAIEFPTALIMFVFATPIASMMSSEPSVVSCTADYFRIVGLSEPLTACWISIVWRTDWGRLHEMAHVDWHTLSDSGATYHFAFLLTTKYGLASRPTGHLAGHSRLLVDHRTAGRLAL
jgi:Na+-driven multidrug efflux pump